MTTTPAAPLPQHAAKVLTVLVELGGETAASTTDLAVLAGYSLPWTKDALTLLEDRGYVVVERRRRNHYAGDPTGRTLRLAAGVS